MVIDGLEVCDAKLALYIVDKYDLYQINDACIISDMLDLILHPHDGAASEIVEMMRRAKESAREAAFVPPKGTPKWTEFWRS